MVLNARCKGIQEGAALANLGKLEILSSIEISGLLKDEYLNKFIKMRCKTITKLQLSGIQTTTPAGLESIAELKNLSILEFQGGNISISFSQHPVRGVTDQVLLSILENGCDLTELDLSMCRELTDKAAAGIAKYCPNLVKFSLFNSVFYRDHAIAPILEVKTSQKR
jgi:hypothetical protein